jgi:hypothetical protein
MNGGSSSWEDPIKGHNYIKNKSLEGKSLAKVATFLLVLRGKNGGSF